MDAVIVMPTLDIARASVTADVAAKMAGVSCGIVLVGEAERRGGVIPTNAGLVAALELEPRFIVHLNDDARPITEGWLACLIDALELAPSYGMAAPSGPCRSIPQSKGYPGMPRGVTVVEHPLANFCQVVRAEVYIQVGLHDENLIHYSDESDFSMRARRLGWQEIWVQHVYVDHEVTDKIEDWWEHDRAYYKRKWR